MNHDETTHGAESAFAARGARGIGPVSSTCVMLALLVAPARSQGHVPKPVRDSKVHPDILMHRDQKRRPGDRTPEDHVRAVHELRLDAHDLDREECVLYVAERLSAEAVSDLSRVGVDVLEGTWVPPVPGRHPAGFHLAEVRYEALPLLDRDPRVLRVDSAEVRHEPHNDLGAELIGVRDVQNGLVGTPRDGSGVNIAVADSSFDLTHPDLPAPVEAFDVTDGTGVANWGANVSSTASGHGTHVLGTVGGDGTASGGTYAGAAPGASYYLYKIGEDCGAVASIADEVEAINRAVAVGCDVFSMSYGGISTYMDGSGAMSQAIDAATNSGVVSFISAGNDANDAAHDSAFVAPGNNLTVNFLVSNVGGAAAFVGAIQFQVIWRDNQTNDGNVSLSATNLGVGESLINGSATISARGTESRVSTLIVNVPAGQAKTYFIRIANAAASGVTPRVHLYNLGTVGTFNSPDILFTVGSPAIADTAVAVGALAHRRDWTDFQGNNQSNNQTVGSVASFSSRGPRIDGLMKPQIVAPGAETVSARDAGNGPGGSFTCPGCGGGCLVTNGWRNFPVAGRTIDDDGLNLNGTGPANYYVIAGTSMATPMAAGVAALVLEEDPTLSPAEVLGRLQSTASLASSPNVHVGAGLIDAAQAVRSAQPGITWVDFAAGGFESGTYAEPWSTLVEGVFFSAPGATIRIKAGASSETITLASPRTLEAFGGVAIVGQ